MFIVDVGQAQVEEVNVGVAGANYGWSEREGRPSSIAATRTNRPSLPTNDAELGFTYPAVQYRHDLGRAITGCCVYRGRLLSALHGKYVFGDIASGRIFFVDAAQLINGKVPGSRRSSSSTLAARGRCSRSSGTTAGRICASARTRPARFTC